MAMKYSEIDALIESGKAHDELQGFFRSAHAMYVAEQLGKTPEYPAVNEILVAMRVLHRLMDTTDGRRLLGIRATNKKDAYNAKKYEMASPEFRVALHLVMGKFSFEEARERLEKLLNDADHYPDPKTLNTLFDELIGEARFVRDATMEMLRAGGWDGSDEVLQETLESLTREKKKHDT